MTTEVIGQSGTTTTRLGARVSETGSEKKRGRPAAFDYEVYAPILNHFHEVRSHRGQRNVLYRQRAMRVLGDRFPWLYDPAACRRGDPKGWKSGILTALGRITSEVWMRRAARFVTRRKPRTIRDGERLIRRWQIGVVLFTRKTAARKPTL